MAAAILLAALLAGMGGLLFELLAFRRFGLAAGNTAAASAWVLGGYLFGLSAGGWWVYRRLGLAGPAPRPIIRAALLYLLVALCGCGADAWAASTGPVGSAFRLLLLWAALAVVPPLAMGVAFPLLFASRRAPGPGLLVGANLLGSVVAAWGGGNWLIPELGMAWTRWLAGGAYTMAAVWLWIGAGSRRRIVPLLPGGAVGATRAAGPSTASVVQIAAAAGFVTLGFEAYLFRRLPFYLEGFQPTLAGVLAAVLLALTVGAVVLPWLFRRWIARRPLAVAGWSLAAGAVLTCSGTVEWLVPQIARWPVRSEWGLHGRVLVAALVASGPAAIALGGVVPILLRGCPAGASRGRLAGAASFGHGIGALLGALSIGHGLPLLLPIHFHAVAMPLVASVGLLLAWRAGRWSSARTAEAASAGDQIAVPVLPALVLIGALSALGVAGAGTPWQPRAPIAGSRYDHPEDYRHLSFRTDAIGTASVSYDERHHSMLLFTNEFRAAETGPATDYMRALGQLPFLLREELPRTAVIALGTGTTATALSDWPGPVELHVVEISPAVLDQVAWFSGDGPLRAGSMAPAWQLDPRTEVHLTDGRRFLAQREPGSLDLVTMEPLLPYAPGTVPLYTREFYRLAAAALSEQGLCVQWVPTHAMPAPFFETLLSTFARSFEHSSAWLVDSATLLVGSQLPHAPDFAAIERRIRGAPAEVRAALHRSGLARAVDLDVAYVGDRIAEACEDAPDLVDDRPFLERIGYWSNVQKLGFFADNLAVLQRVAAASVAGDRALAEGPRDRDVARVQRLEALADLSLAVLEHPGSNERARRAARTLAGLRTRWLDSILLYREANRALRRSLEREVGQAASGLAARLARRQIARSPNSPVLQAYAAGQAGPSDALSDADRALFLRTARALDPAVARLVRDPELRRRLLEVPGEPSPLAELFQLPTGDALVEVATGSTLTARTLRAVFPVRIGRALVDALRRGPLTADRSAGLRDCADPLLLELAVGAILARGGAVVDELSPLWRTDLPMPESLLRAMDRTAPTADRLALAGLLERRRGPRARRALAGLLTDPILEVREAAAVTLFANFRSRVAYDPRWPVERLKQAAAAIRR